MPNDLTTQRNSLNWRTDTRQSLENKGFFPRGGGGILWVISGIALASCGGGGGGGSSSGGGRPLNPIILRDTNRNVVDSYTGSIDEDGTTATLPTIDASVDGEPQTSTYDYEFVTDANTDATDATHLGFTIDANGAITFTGTAGTDLDYETTPRRTLTVRVTYDADGDTTDTSDQETRDVDVVIGVGNVIDQSEDIILMQDGNVVDSYTGSIDEDGANADLPTISASADGAVSGHSISYVFRRSDGSTNILSDSRAFGIESSNNLGEIRFDANVLDYETTSRYELTVIVLYDVDGDPRTIDDQVTRDVDVVITVNDVEGIRLRDADDDVVDSYTASVDEDASAGTSIVTIDASVDDAPQDSQLFYHFVRSDSALVDEIRTSMGNFAINISTGQITSSVVLDYETTPRYELTVRVTYDADGDGGIFTTNDQITRDVDVVITVNDVEGIRLRDADDDVVDSYTASVDEDASAGTSIVTIDASVDDAPQDSQLFYHFVRSDSALVDEIRTSMGNFAINISTGQITSSVVLDYETTPRYELTVRVTYDADGDGGIFTTNDQITRDVQVVITVNDPNEASPAIIPDRQAFAHQDPYEPDDLGLTPMPDADPSAG